MLLFQYKMQFKRKFLFVVSGLVLLDSSQITNKCVNCDSTGAHPGLPCTWSSGNIITTSLSNHTYFN